MLWQTVCVCLRGQGKSTREEMRVKLMTSGRREVQTSMGMQSDCAGLSGGGGKPSLLLLWQPTDNLLNPASSPVGSGTPQTLLRSKAPASKVSTLGMLAAGQLHGRLTQSSTHCQPRSLACVMEQRWGGKVAMLGQSRGRHTHNTVFCLPRTSRIEFCMQLTLGIPTHVSVKGEDTACFTQ